MEPYQRLERLWADFNDLDPKGMVACSSGTAALHLAFEALRLPQGAEVLCPDFTMIACPRAISMAGLTPVFVDCDDRLLMDNGLVGDERCHDAQAILVVHVYGREFDFSGWNWTCWTVEDLAEAHGVKPWQHTDAACWSFYRNKIVAGEEGGAVWFRDPDHAALARQLRSLGFTDKHDFRHIPRGHNYRLSNANTEPILRSIMEWGSNFNARRIIECEYDRWCPQEWKLPHRDAPWVYDLRIPGLTEEQQDRIVVRVQVEAGLAARHAFKPCSMQEEYLDARTVCRGDLAEAGARRGLIASREVVYLPLTPGAVSAEQARRAFAVIRSCL